MKKSEYLSSIEGFLSYLLTVSPAFQHSYTDKSSKKQWNTNGLLDAAKEVAINESSTLSGYLWKFSCIAPDDNGGFERCKGKTLQASADALSKLKDYLDKQLEKDNDLGAFLACQSVLDWGGVWSNGNNLRLYKQANCLAETLNSLKIELKEHQSDSADDEKYARIIEEKFWMNAGSTKIFSILLPDFCIYDGRVGAALGMLARNYCRYKKLPETQEELAFPWGTDRGNETGKKSRRNPSDDLYRFPRLTNDTFEHARWNIRANWLLQALAKKMKVPSTDRVGAVRRLEAAFFMIGYDVNGSSTPSTDGARATEVSKKTKQDKNSAPRSRGETKRSKAKSIYLANSGRPRKEIIKKFIDECGLTEKGASTYYSTFRKEHG